MGLLGNQYRCCPHSALWAFVLQETYAPTILKRRVDRLRKQTGNERLHTEFDTDKPLIKVLQTATVRPFRLLTTQPIVQLVAVYMVYLFGLLYLILSTFPGDLGRRLCRECWNWWSELLISWDWIISGSTDKCTRERYNLSATQTWQQRHRATRVPDPFHVRRLCADSDRSVLVRVECGSKSALDNAEHRDRNLLCWIHHMPAVHADLHH